MDDDGGLLLNISSAPLKRPEKSQTSIRRDFPGPESSRNYGRVDKKRSEKFKKAAKPAKLASDKQRAPGSIRVDKATYEERKKRDKDTFVSAIFQEGDEVEPDLEPAPSVKALEATNAPLEKDTFEGLGISPDLVKVLTSKLNLSKPTAIQRASIPPLMQSDQDLFIQAQTGSGKTLSYLLPIMQRLAAVPNLHRSSGLFALILVPTRELVTQIYSVLELLVTSCHYIVPGVVLGGEKKKAEKARIRKGVNILVATPGRLADHFDNTTSLDLSQLRWVVLDEGDRLMELGFEETLTKILDEIKARSNITRRESLPEKRVHILCSATMKGKVRTLGEITLQDGLWVTADSKKNEVPNEAPQQLIQTVLVVPTKLRLVTLASLLLGAESYEKCIVFFSCTDSVDFHFAVFTKQQAISTRATSESELFKNTVFFKLHGSMSQSERTSTLAGFRNCPSTKRAVLLCTDVASRGLDLPSVSCVVEYDAPFSVEDHLHRVGRTARAGASGSAFLFLLPGAEEGYVSDKLEKVHGKNIVTGQYQRCLQIFSKNDWQTVATTWHLEVERWLLENPAMLELARKGFQSHIRAYTTHLSGERQIFNIKALHLGHIAKSFGLREAPAGMGGSKEAPVKKKKPLKSARMIAHQQTASEFNY